MEREEELDEGVLIPEWRYQLCRYRENGPEIRLVNRSRHRVILFTWSGTVEWLQFGLGPGQIPVRHITVVANSTACPSGDRNWGLGARTGTMFVWSSQVTC